MNTTADGSAEITRLIRALADIQRPAEIAQYFSQTAILYEGMVPGVFRGVDAIVTGFAAQMHDIASIHITFRELAVDAVDDLGYAHSIQHAVVQLVGGGTREATFRQTDILRKTGGTWRIVHEHVSYPVDPITGQAVFSTPAG